jgi:hypothetical protein
MGEGRERVHNCSTIGSHTSQSRRSKCWRWRTAEKIDQISQSHLGISEEELREGKGEILGAEVKENKDFSNGRREDDETEIQGLQSDEMQTPAPEKEERKWKKIRKWSCCCLFLSLLMLGIIIAVDIILFYFADSSFDTETVNF